MEKKQMQQKWDELCAHIDAVKTSAKQAEGENRQKVEETMETAKSNVNAARENVRLSSERSRSKIGAELLKAQMNADHIRDEIAKAKAEHDKNKAQRALDDAEDYAAASMEVALLAIDEAHYAVMQALDAKLDFEEKYGAVQGK